ncbi:MAG: CRISPR-associated CARF protein Csx1 [Fervidicoccaceae archaeon]
MSNHGSKDQELIIATWGAPWVWRKTKYVLHEEGVSESVESCSSVFALAKKHKNAKVIIVGADSLLDYEQRQNGRGEDQFCGDIFYDVADKLKIEPLSKSMEKYSSYEEIILDAKKLISETAKRMSPEGLTLNNMEAIIMPMLGKPSEVTFNGGPRDPFSVLLFELFKITKDSSKDSSFGKIYLDLSQGVNYMPSLLLQAAKMLASLSLFDPSIDTKDVVEIKAFNSEPARKLSEIALHEIYWENVGTIQVPLGLGDSREIKVLDRRTGTEGDDGKKAVDSLIEFNENFDKIKGSVSKVLKSLRYPVPLLLRYSCSTIEDYREFLNALDDAFSLWKENTVINSDGKRIERRLELNYWGLYSYSLSYKACSQIKDSERQNADGSTKPQNSNDVIMYLDEFNEIAEKIYRRVSRAFEPIIKNEVSNIEKKIEEKGEVLNKGECQKLDELFRKEGDSEERGSGASKGTREPDRRIVIAHAGLQREYVEVCREKEGGRIYLRYIADSPERILKILE